MNQIKKLREDRGLTQEQLGELVGTSGATIQRLETGRRRLTEDWMRRIADALVVQPSALFGETVIATGAGLPVKGEVQAGVWHEAEAVHEPRFGTIPIGPDPRYFDKEQWALLAQGTSMNKRFQHGEYIVCVKWSDLGRQPRNNDLVVIERRRDGMTETTVKRISVKGKELWLMPESDDPKWQTPLPFPNGQDGEEAEITALVVGRYEQF